MGHACQIAVVIPTYNRREALERCIDSLLRQTRRLDGIFVVDNASVDGTQDMVKDRFPNNVILIRLEENTGSAGGFYEGIRAAYLAGYDWVWAMDNDAEAQPDALEALVESPCFADPLVGLLGSLIVGRDGSIQYAHSMHFSPLMRQIPAESKHSALPVCLDAKSYTGALIHRRAIDLVGLPPRNFFAYQDDLDYTYKISRRLQLFLVPQSRIIHDSEVKIWELSQRKRWLLRSRRWPFEVRYRIYYSMRNSIYFHTRSVPRFLVPLILIKTAYSLIKGVLAILIFDEKKCRRMSLIIRAAVDGLAGRLGKVALE